jgi:hypothetical protein
MDWAERRAKGILAAITEICPRIYLPHGPREETNNALRAIIAQALRAEREACARVCDEYAKDARQAQEERWAQVADYIGNAIRTRGTPLASPEKAG